MSRNELILVVLHLRRQRRARQQLLLQRLLAEIGCRLHVGSHALQHLSRLHLRPIHLHCNVMLEYFLDEFGELSDSFVKEWKELVGLKAEITRQLIYCLILEAHTCQSGSLHI